MLILTWVSIVVLAYIYVGYPTLLRLIVALRGPRPVHRRDITPSVSFVISAYNEAAVIRQKLLNALQLDYPHGYLEIAVVSDASTDGTDEIVRELADRGVTLIRQPERRGKTAGLNDAVPRLRGEIVVFSDANAMYQPDAIRKLVRNFADPGVGCVTGEARYLKGPHETAAQFGERAYWDFEIQQKRLETCIGSMVGGDGAIYAIRASLWRRLPETAINDFLNPLQIVEAGWRAIYEPEAVCYEETAGAAGREYARRVRIVSRSWRAVFQARGVLNPFKVGFFALSIVSHKVLRWWSGLFVLTAVAGLAWHLASGPGTLPPSVILAACAVLAALMLLQLPKRLVALGFYFAVIQAASLVGIAEGTVGRVSAVWRSPRELPDSSEGSAQRVGWLLTLALSIIGLAGVAAAGPRTLVLAVFWVSVAALGYVFVAYPVLVGVLSWALRRRVIKQHFEPSVVLLIVANDEAGVMDAKLQNSLSLDYPRARYRILVASDGSVDATNEIVRSYASQGVELLAFPERRGKMSAINGAVEAIGNVDVIVFSDANVFLQPGTLRELVAKLADPRVGGVSGNVILVGDRAALAAPEDLYHRYERWLQSSESAIGSMVGVDGALYALRASAFSPQPPDTILDDMAIPMAVLRKGYRVVFEPAALAAEQGSQSAWEEFSRKSRVIAGAAQFLLRGATQIPFRRPQVVFSLFSHKILRWLSPVLAMTTLACSAALAPGSQFYMVVAAAHGGVLALGLAGCAPELRRLWLIGLVHYYCLVEAAAMVGFVRGLRGRQPTAWQRFSRTPVHDPLIADSAGTAATS